MRNSTIIEETIIRENGQQAVVVKREIEPDGKMSIYQNDVFMSQTIADYAVFIAAKNGKANQVEWADSIVPHSTYQVCGSTLPHEFISKNSETINTEWAGLVELGTSEIVSFLLSKLIGPAAGIMVIAAEIYSIIHSTPCEYIDVTEYKYFVHDYEENISKNCFHTYLVFYNITATGSRQVVDAHWSCSEVIL